MAARSLHSTSRARDFAHAGREVEHRARKRDAVVDRAHDGGRRQHLHAERAHALDQVHVLAVETKPSISRRYSPATARGEGSLPSSRIILPAEPLQRLAADDRRHGDHRRAALAQQLAHPADLQDRTDDVVGIRRADDHGLEVGGMQRVEHLVRNPGLVGAGVFDAAHARLARERAEVLRKRNRAFARSARGCAPGRRSSAARAPRCRGCGRSRG